LPRRSSRSGDDKADTAGDLEGREYRGEDNNVHHHTRSYMRQQKGTDEKSTGEKQKRPRRAVARKEARAEPTQPPARQRERKPARSQSARSQSNRSQPDRSQPDSGATRAPAKAAPLGLSNRTILLMAVAGVVALGLGARQARDPSKKQITG
jgi:uncharacterized membrane protein